MRWLGTLIGLLFSFACLILIFSRVDLNLFIANLRSANYLYVFPIVGLVFLGTFVRAIRWQWLLLSVKKAHLSPLFVATVIGYMANSLLPARAGEFLRAQVIGKGEGISRTAAFATIVVERLFDGLSMLSMMCLALFFLRLPEQRFLLSAAVSAFGFYLLLIGAIIIFNLNQKVLSSWLGRRFGHKAEQFASSLAEGLKLVGESRNFIIIVLYSFLIWLLVAASIFITVLAFGQQISFPAAILIMVLLSFAVMVPSSPAYVGTFHAAMVYGLMLFGMTKEMSLSLAVVFHGLSFLPIVLLGLYYLWRERINLY